MKRTLAILLALGLVAAIMAAPATAKKKKVKLVKSEATFFLRWEAGAETCDGPKFLSRSEGENGAGSCAFIFQGAQEVFVATGAAPALANDWPATDGVPFKIDSSRPIMGHFVIRGQGAPQARLEIAVTGSSKGNSVTLGEAVSDDYTIVASGQTGPAEIDLEIDLDKSLNKKDMSSLNLNTTIRGFQASGYIDLDAPSYITIPVWVKK